jgi:hypothetical protein
MQGKPNLNAIRIDDAGAAPPTAPPDRPARPAWQACLQASAAPAEDDAPPPTALASALKAALCAILPDPAAFAAGDAVTPDPTFAPEGPDGPDAADEVRPLLPGPSSPPTTATPATTASSGEPPAQPDAPEPPRRPSARAGGRDTLLAGLGRRFRGATMEVEVELCTATVRQVFRRDFAYVSRQAHALESSRRVQGIDRRRLTEALLAIEGQGEAIRISLKDLAVQAHERMARMGGRPPDLQAPRVATLQATIVSPCAHLFLDLMRLADDAVLLLEGAWLMGTLNSAERAALINECRRALIGFKETVRQQRHSIGEHVRAVNEERRLARGRGPSPAVQAPLRLRASGPRPAPLDSLGRDGDGCAAA